jgi:hypothetical protein
MHVTLLRVMPNFFNDRFELLLMIDLSCLKLEYKMIFVIIESSLICFAYIYIYIYIYIFVPTTAGGGWPIR